VAQLYPQAPSTHFSRLLRHAWATHHTTKTVETGGIAPSIHNLDTKRSFGRFTSRERVSGASKNIFLSVFLSLFRD
jgi:hypothetical protein